jgi:GYF domain 2
MTDEPESAPRWFYVEGGRRMGPVAASELVAAIIGGDLPEDALVWRAGLGEWVKANSLEEVQRELPPPIPRGEEKPPAEEEDAGAGERADDPRGEASSSEGRRRRRHHRERQRPARRPNWLVPLIVMVIVVAVVLWYLLLRLNEVPPGQVIIQ